MSVGFWQRSLPPNAPLQLQLLLSQFLIQRRLLQQFPMRPLLDNYAVFEGDDAVSALDRGQPVGDNYRGLVSEDSVEIPENPVSGRHCHRNLDSGTRQTLHRLIRVGEQHRDKLLAMITYYNSDVNN